MADSEHVVAGNFAISSQGSCVLILELSATTFLYSCNCPSSADVFSCLAASSDIGPVSIIPISDEGTTIYINSFMVGCHTGAV